MKRTCGMFSCPRLLGEFEGREGERYCPECAERLRRATRPTLAKDSRDWDAVGGHLDGNYRRRNHLSGR